MSFDPELFGKAMGDAVRAAVDPLQAKIAALEKALDAVSKSIPDAVPGLPGKDCDMDQVKAWLLDEVKAIPIPKDGESVTLKDLEPLLAEAVGAIKRSADESVQAAIKSMPDPVKGKDGADIADLLINRDGELVATLTDGRMKNLGVIIGKNGEDGKDGTDGVGLDSFELDYVAESHEVVIKAVCGERVKEARFPAGGIHAKGYWREGVKAVANEAWTHDGSLWVAKSATSERPSAASADWVLAARKGRDGDSAKDAKPATPIKLKG